MKNFLILFVVAPLFNFTLSFAVNNAESKPFISESNREALDQASYLRGILSNDSISETCGGVLANPTGGIIYKVLGPIQKNEQCVWIIRGGSAYSFNLDMLYIRDDSDAQVLATCVQKSYTSVTHTIVAGSGPVAGFSLCHLVVITYSTAENVPASATGFVFQYSAVQGGTVSNLSKDHFININQPTILRHPESETSTYENNELTTFTFVSKNADGNNNPSATASLTYIKNQLEGDCYDSLNVFNFDSTLRTWQPGTQICDAVNLQLITNQDAVLVIFDSDISGQFGGFTLIHSSSGGCGT